MAEPPDQQVTSFERINHSATALYNSKQKFFNESVKGVTI